LPHEITLELFELSMAIDSIGHATASRLGINQTDLICLERLVSRGPMGAGELAATLGLTTAAISAMASRLEAAGYARREMDPNDRRRVVLHALPAGARQAFSLFDGLYRAANDLDSEYSERDQKKLLGLLRRFRQLIVEHDAEIRTEPPGEQPSR
jgi:DNA-binding MarR family transcriptional regulator